MAKQFKNIDEQIDILKEKGLIINDVEYAKKVLLRENYFFLSGYKAILYYSKKDRRFIKGTTFEEFYSIFLFDRNFRNILFKNLVIIENSIKSIFSYRLSSRYGIKEEEYLKAKNFSEEPSRSKQINDLLRKMKRQIRVNTKQHNATLHFSNNHGYIPFWVLVKVLSFGIVSELYAILKLEDKLAIAVHFDLDVGNLENYLPILANYRNLCAHEDILYNNKTQREIADTKYHRLLDIPLTNEEYIYGKNDILAVVIILKSMLLPEQFDKMMYDFKEEIKLLDHNVDTISMDKLFDEMGIPKNFWKIKDL